MSSTAATNPIYPQIDRHALDSSWFEAALPDLQSVLDYMRGRNPDLHGALRLTEPSAPEDGPHSQVAVIRNLAGRPAVIAAVAVGPVDAIPAARDNAAPIIMSVKFIDSEALAGIAAQLRLTTCASSTTSRRRPPT